LSSDNHLVDGQTDRQTDMSKAIYPLFFKGGHKNYFFFVQSLWKRVAAEKVQKYCPSHVFQLTGTFLELNSRIKDTNVLTKFHENWVKSVTSIVSHVFTISYRVISPTHWRPYINKTNVLKNFHDDWAKILTSRVFTRTTAPPTGVHVFQRTRTTFELNQHIIKANILTNFEHDRDIIRTNVLTEFHEDRTKNVASRVFTNKCGQTTDKDRTQKLT
ncbi:hypothetical protein DPMN_146773, partial [Dreissena polymorpha]